MNATLVQYTNSRLSCLDELLWAGLTSCELDRSFLPDRGLILVRAVFWVGVTQKLSGLNCQTSS